MKAARIILVAFCFQVCALAAESPVQIWSAGEIGGIAAGLKGPAEKESIAGKPLGSYGNHSTAVWRRSRSGQAELHRTKTDLIVVTAGEATLVYGGSIPDGKPTSAVEVRGKAIAGGESRKIGPGDIVRVPAGTPHQFVLAAGQSVSYFAIKIATAGAGRQTARQ